MKDVMDKKKNELIVTQWDVNIPTISKTIKHNKELIVTQWDVNRFQNTKWIKMKFELIVTSWDVNTIFYIPDKKDSSN